MFRIKQYIVLILKEEAEQCNNDKCLLLSTTKTVCGNRKIREIVQVPLFQTIVQTLPNHEKGLLHSI